MRWPSILVLWLGLALARGQGPEDVVVTAATTAAAVTPAEAEPELAEALVHTPPSAERRNQLQLVRCLVSVSYRLTDAPSTGCSQHARGRR